MYLFTDNNLQSFKGPRPPLNLDLHWTTYTSNDTVSTWLENAYETADDSIRVVIGNSSATGTFYTNQYLSYQTADSGFDVILEQGKTFVKYRNSSNINFTDTVEVDTSTLRVSIYANKFFADASCIKASLEAIRDITRRKINTTVAGSIQNIPSTYDWLFWLSEDAVPAPLLKNNVFVYESGKSQKKYSVIITDDKTSDNKPIALYGMFENNTPDTSSSQTIWKNGFGDAVLRREIKDATIYRFYNRFNPQWNDLPWSNQFPQIIYDLIYKKVKL